jgi:hypothetical protein
MDSTCFRYCQKIVARALPWPARPVVLKSTGTATSTRGPQSHSTDQSADFGPSQALKLGHNAVGGVYRAHVLTEGTGLVSIRRSRPATSVVVALAGVAPVAQAAVHSCLAEGHYYSEGTRVESYRVTGVRTRTAVPVYVICRGGKWVWPSTNEPVERQRKQGMPRRRDPQPWWT